MNQVTMRESKSSHTYIISLNHSHMYSDVKSVYLGANPEVAVVKSLFALPCNHGNELDCASHFAELVDAYDTEIECREAITLLEKSQITTGIDYEDLDR